MLTSERFHAYCAEVDNKLQSVNADKQEEMDKNLDLTFEEHFRFQQTQAESFAGGKIDQAVAQLIYISLGESMSQTNGGWQPGVPLARKFAITKLMGELLSAKVRAMRP